MCGICGFIGERDPARLEQMLCRLVHRGPDEEGRHEEAGISLGVRRLRVIDLEGGRQPISNGTGTVWVVLNGEIYNYRELREELIGKGHRFVSRCDTEVLVHLYEQEGEAGVHRLRGMFAYALWDRERKVLLLVRDRMGIKPLYYTLGRTSDNGERDLAFASELPALLAACAPCSIDPRALSQYLSFLYVPAPGTVYEGIRQLLPGELLRVSNGTVEVRRYYSLARTTIEEGMQPAAEAEAEFVERMRETVRAHLVSDVPLGLFLSGGLDSGAILAMMRGATNGVIRTFSIGYDAAADRSYDELDAARELADHFGTDHVEERLRPDAVTLLPKIVAAMGEPFADASAIPTYLVSALARRRVTVALSGIGGDELFGGYPRYLGIRLAARYAHLPVAVRAWAAAHVAPYLPETADGRDSIGRIRRFLRYGHESLAAQYVRWVTFVLPECGPSAFTPELLAQASPEEMRSRHEAAFNDWPSDEPADLAMGLDLRTYLPDDLLRMGDRLSMAHSLELRVPFCDHELLAFALSLPASARFAGWRLKGFMRRALRRVLPPATLARAKFGFQVPLARWLREDLKEVVHDLLSDSIIRRRGLLNSEYVRWLVQEHETGRRNFADQLYALLVLELWHQTVPQMGPTVRARG